MVVDIFCSVPAERVVSSLCTGLQRKDQLGSALDPQIHSAGSKKRSRVWVRLKIPADYHNCPDLNHHFWGCAMLRSFLDKPVC